MGQQLILNAFDRISPLHNSTRRYLCEQKPKIIYKGKSFNCLIDSTTVVVELLLVFIHSCIQPFPIKHCPTVDNEIPSDDNRQTSFPFHAPPFPVCSWERKLQRTYSTQHITVFIKLISSLLKLRSMTQIPSLYTLWTCNTMMVTVIDNYSKKLMITAFMVSNLSFCFFS